MASSSLPPYTIFLLFFFTTSLFFFSRRALEPKISLYRDGLSQTPLVFSLLSPRSAENDTITTPLANTKTPIFSKSDTGDSLAQEVTPISSKSEDTQGLEASTKIPILPKSDFDDNLVQKVTPVSSKSEDTKGLEISNETPTLSKSDFDDSLYQKVTPISSEYKDTDDLKVLKETPILSKSEFDDNLVEKNSKPISSRFEDAYDAATKQVVDSALGTRNEEKLVDPGFKGEGQVVSDDGKGFGWGQSCDLFKGSWVKDENHPIYKPGSCPYVDEAFDCQSNGRPDTEYLKWRWKPDGCDLPRKNYYKEGDHIYPKFDAVEAYRRALKTWAKWIDENMSREKLIIYRGYSSAHYRGGDWDSGGSCNKETEPVSTGAILGNYPLKMKIVEEVIKEMQLPIVLLNITQSTNFRKDGHPSVYGKVATAGRRAKQDCSHWCLPGVPDAWNELIYATLVLQQ